MTGELTPLQHRLRRAALAQVRGRRSMMLAPVFETCTRVARRFSYRLDAVLHVKLARAVGRLHHPHGGRLVGILQGEDEVEEIEAACFALAARAGVSGDALLWFGAFASEGAPFVAADELSLGTFSGDLESLVKVAAQLMGQGLPACGGDIALIAAEDRSWMIYLAREGDVTLTTAD